jgi:carboxymethylenebutenolidase
MTHETVSAGGSLTFQAYVSEPASPNGNAVVLLQEIFGLTKHVKAVADRFAEDGYLTYAPDLFWRIEPGVELSHSKDDVQKAMGLLRLYRDEDGIADIRSTVAHIRRRADFSGKVAAAGLCLGGKLAYLAATMPEVDAGVSFYGVGIERRLDAASLLKCPLLLHFGEQDSYVSEAARREIASALKGKAVETHLYPAANHGFYTRGDPVDMATARERTNRFLRQALGH